MVLSCIWGAVYQKHTSTVQHADDGCVYYIISDCYYNIIITNTKETGVFPPVGSIFTEKLKRDWSKIVQQNDRWHISLSI